MRFPRFIPALKGDDSLHVKEFNIDEYAQSRTRTFFWLIIGHRVTSRSVVYYD